MSGPGSAQSPNNSADMDVDKEGDDGEESDEWEEELVYVELDDVKSIQELFELEPDQLELDGDVLKPKSSEFEPGPSSSTIASGGGANRDSNRSSRGIYGKSVRGRGWHPGAFPRARPPTEIPQEKIDHSQIDFTFHGLESNEPILELRGRYYTGKYEDIVGTGLIFREKPQPSDEPGPSSSTDHDQQQQPSTFDPSKPKNTLRKLTRDLSPPPDPVFGLPMIPKKKEYELIANVTKMIRMEHISVIYADEPRTSAKDNYIDTYESSGDEDGGDGVEEVVETEQLAKIRRELTAAMSTPTASQYR